MSTVMLLNHSEIGRKKGAVRGRESRNQSLNTKLTPTEFAAVEVAAATCCGLWPHARDSPWRPPTNCSTKSAMRSTNLLRSWLLPREGNRQWRRRCCRTPKPLEYHR